MIRFELFDEQPCFVFLKVHFTLAFSNLTSKLSAANEPLIEDFVSPRSFILLICVVCLLI
jgi:hypothetical protein